MKICLPTDSNLGLQSGIAANFSAARWLQVIDSDTLETSVHDTTDASLRDRPIDMDLILCRAMPERLFDALSAQGVPIFGTRARNVAEALADYHEGGLRELGEPVCCRGRDADCDGEHVDAACETDGG